MAVKGSIAKEQLIKKILETFPNSFSYNDGKEVRINCEENGLPVQIKLTFTCAKIAVSPNDGTVNEVSIASNASTEKSADVKPTDSPIIFDPQEPTQEEKDRLAKLLKSL